ncbi:biliverdin-producing heme oxygenase [Halomonas sp. BM-2019]|uniref:biliverdin-producing heme oxygenase n=1 Tax=Halomonas sp. BM-2019 TaxID=2811227 RepID=UPI001B3C21D3|nr:MAG: biliverdin-producing heme oxygenase [Halomonas sp. BM-2019]
MAKRLRDGTRGAHHALDHHPHLQRLIRPGLTPAGYGASLLALYAPHAGLEQGVAEGVARLGLGEPSPSRLARLQADLEALGLAAPVFTPVRLLPVATTAAELVGQRYVLEGSRLGSQVIVRLVRGALGPAAPLGFFSTPAPERHWHDFLAFAEHNCPSDQHDMALAAAQATFDAFLASLDRTPLNLGTA